jgi:hypothetical protein
MDDTSLSYWFPQNKAMYLDFYVGFIPAMASV